jgi:hypothetical protein
MFKLANCSEIGNHLAKLIDKKYDSKRQFCKAYLNSDEKSLEQDSIITDEEIRKMQNRLSQILKGKKSIQAYDLPIFSRLLEVSCEEILNAGKSFSPVSDRMTNYRIAFETDPTVWEKYINREDKLILNADEYGKTVIDYALEFRNFGFMKFLMDNKYIWFVDSDEKRYGCTFGAGTSIDPRCRKLTQDSVQIDFQNDSLRSLLAEQDCLRMKMIALAIEHNDIAMLDELRAREIPSLYFSGYLNCIAPDCNKYYNAEMLQSLAGASDEILDYFSKEFVIEDSTKKHPNTFLFPFLSELIDLLIKNKSNNLKNVLKRAIEHNEKTFNKLSELVRESIEAHPGYQYLISDDFSNKRKGGSYSKADTDKYRLKLKQEILNGVSRELEFHENGKIVLFRFPHKYKGILTNVVHTSVKSNDDITNHFIENMNDLYEKVRNFDVKQIDFGFET